MHTHAHTQRTHVPRVSDEAALSVSSVVDSAPLGIASTKTEGEPTAGRAEGEPAAVVTFHYMCLPSEQGPCEMHMHT